MSSSGPPLRGADLRHVDLRDQPLAGVDLAGADLRGVDLRGRDLSRAVLAGADLRGAKLDGADLSHADLQDAELDGATLAGAACTGADLRRVRALGVVATGLGARGARLDGSEWRQARLVGADLEGVQAVGARFDAAELGGARLVNARLDRAVLDDASLDGADLTGARLVGAALGGARGYPRVRDANLEGADLRVAGLERFLGEGVRVTGARVRVSEAARLQERLRAAGWRPGPVDRLALRALGPSDEGRRARADGATAERQRRADEALAAAEEAKQARAAKEAAEAARREEAELRRREVEARARAELRAAARRRAMATRVATERGLRKASALIAQTLERSRGWKDAIIGRPEDEDSGAEGGLDFPVVAEMRDAAWVARQLGLDDRMRTLARAARYEAGLKSRIEAEQRAQEQADAEARAQARARWEAEAAERARREEEEQLRREAELEAEREAARREAESARAAAEEARQAEAERIRRVAEERAQAAAEAAAREAEAIAAREAEAVAAREAEAARRAAIEARWSQDRARRAREEEAEELRRAEAAWAQAEAERVRREAAEIERARREEERRAREREEQAAAYAEARRREEAQAERARREAEIAAERARREAEARQAREEARQKKLEEARRRAAEAQAEREAAARKAEAERRAREEARRARDEAARKARAEEAERRRVAREAALRAARERAAAAGRAMAARVAPPLAATIGVVALVARATRTGATRAFTLLTTPLEPSKAALEAMRREFVREAGDRERAWTAALEVRDGRARFQVVALRERARAEARARARAEARAARDAARAEVREARRREREAERAERAERARALRAQVDEEALKLRQAEILAAEGTTEGDVEAARIRAQAQYDAAARRRARTARLVDELEEGASRVFGSSFGQAVLAARAARATAQRLWETVAAPAEVDTAAREGMLRDFRSEAQAREAALARRAEARDARARADVLAARRRAARLEAALAAGAPAAAKLREVERRLAEQPAGALGTEWERRRRAEMAFAEAEAARELREEADRARRVERDARRERTQRHLTVAGTVVRGGAVGAARAGWELLFARSTSLDAAEARLLAEEFGRDARDREARLVGRLERVDDGARLGWRLERRDRRVRERRRQQLEALSRRMFAAATWIGALAQRSASGGLRAIAPALQFVADGLWWLAAALSRGAARAGYTGASASAAAATEIWPRLVAAVRALGAAAVATVRAARGQMPTVWEAVAGPVEPEAYVPTPAEMAEFRREAAGRDREATDLSLGTEARLRVRVRKVRRDQESARTAEVARIEAAARARRLAPTRAGSASLAARLRASLTRPPLALGPGVDLRRPSLADRDLTGADLRHARLDGARVVGARLRGVDLRGADLRNAELIGVDLTEARLDGADLTGARLAAVTLHGASLDGVRVEGARFEGVAGLDAGGVEALRAGGAARVDTSGPGVGWALWAPVARAGRSGARLVGAVIGAPSGPAVAPGPAADLRDQQLAEADLAGLDLRGALLSGAGLVGADLRGADLSGADLRGADLSAALLQGAVLDGAQLNGAILDQASLEGARWGSAVVAGARMGAARGLDEATRIELAARGADIEGVVVRPELVVLPGGAEPRPDLGGRVLEGVRRLRDALPSPEPLALGPGADLRGRALDERDLSRLDLSGALLAGSGLVGADLRGTNLRGADLRGADLTAARLEDADLSGARLEDAIFDQAELAGANLADARVERARFATALGLARPLRADLGRRGADLGEGQDARWARATSWALAASLLLVVGAYLGARYLQGLDLDAAALEHAAGEAAREGDPALASVRFEELAAKAEDAEQKVEFLLEAAGSAQEAGDPGRALTLLDQAAVLAANTPAQPQVMLRTAQIQAQAGLSERAVTGLREVLRREDLSPNQQAQALIGLAGLLTDAEQGEVERIERDLLASAATDPQRAALGMALADGWASAGRVQDARAALERALDATVDPSEVVPMRIRLARLVADLGDADGALAMFREIMTLPGGKGDEARLGAAELLARRGAYEDAARILAPMLDAEDYDLRARAELAQATLAEHQGDIDGTVAALRRVLDMDGLEPHITEEARLSLARILVKTDPEAARELVGDSQELKDQVRLGQARVLREEGKRQDARDIWVAVTDDPLAGDSAKIEAELSLAELEVEDNDYDAALRRYDAVLARAVLQTDRQRVMLGSANALVRAGRLQEAEARYDAMLDANPLGDVADQCRLGLARAAELRGQTERATELYQEVGQSQGPWSMEALFALGGMRERMGDFTGAVASYRLAQARPAGEAARRNEVAISLARALQSAGDPAAVAEYARLLEAPDPSVRVAARLAVGASVVGSEPERALELFEEALAETPAGEERQEARAGWLRANVALGRVEKGMDRIRAWLETETDDVLRGELALEAVKALRAEGRYDEALALGERYATEGGFELGMERAGLLREVGRPEAAAALLATLVPGGAEDEAWRLESQAEALIAAGQFAEADAILGGLARVPGAEAAATYMRARVAREQGEYAEALELLGETDDGRAPIERALVLEALGRWEDATVAWRRLALAPDLETRSAGVLGLARAALSRDDAEGALRELDALPVVEPGYALTLAQVRGEALLGMGRVDEARAVYAALTTDAESRTVGALGLGECALAADDPTDAAARFQAAWEGTGDPWYRALALAGLVRARAEAGDLAGATRAFDQLVDAHPDAADIVDSVRGLVGR